MSKYKVIGIIGAMDEEVNNLKDIITDVKVSTFASMDFYQGKISGNDVVVVRSGIGKVNAAICAQILIDKFSVSVIINTGIAGSLNVDINIGDIVLSKDALEYDMDATSFGYDLAVIPRMEESVFKGDEYLIDLTKKVCEENLKDINVFVGRVITGVITEGLKVCGYGEGKRISCVEVERCCKTYAE